VHSKYISGMVQLCILELLLTRFLLDMTKDVIYTIEFKGTFLLGMTHAVGVVLCGVQKVRNVVKLCGFERKYGTYIIEIETNRCFLRVNMFNRCSDTGSIVAKMGLTRALLPRRSI